jgi:alanine racemase
MSQPFRPLRAEINTQNLRHNYRLLKKIAAGNDFFCPMVKAYAYGHDDLVTVKTLIDEGCMFFGVALIEEGLRLRAADLAAKTILVFHPLQNSKDAQALIENHLTPVLSSWREIEILEALTRAPLTVHVKFNTGMNRLGFERREADKLKTFFQNHKHLRLTGVCTHFFNSEDWLSVEGHTRKQLTEFAALEKKFAGADIFFHALNSSAMVANFCGDAPAPYGSRPGIALYGIKPLVECVNAAQKQKYDELIFKPVMSIHSQIILTHELQRGERVSYGGRFVAEKDSLIGVVPIGYADGFFRHFSSKGVMLCDSRRVPVTGTVCMDFTMLNLTGLPQPETGWVGEGVTILGETLQADELAQIIGTNSYEILTNISRRVPRVFV